MKRTNLLGKNQVIAILRKEQPFLKSKFGVKKIAIFGSFAKGNQKRSSDIDIFVELEKPLGLEFFQMSEYLGKKLGRKADVLTPGGMKGIRLKEIAQDIKQSMVYVET